MPDILKRIAWFEKDNVVPREIFTDPDIYKLEMEKIFKGPVWITVGHESEIPNSGDFKTTYIGETPIIVTRDKGNQIHVMLNSCPHRSSQVEASPCGNAKILTCIYHKWTFKLDGSLNANAMPEDFPPDFKKEDYGLAKLRVEVYAGVIFASFSDQAPPLQQYLGTAVQEALDSTFQGKLKCLGSQKYMIEANWKLFMENHYDGYHAPLVHKAVHVLRVGLEKGGFINTSDTSHSILESVYKKSTGESAAHSNESLKDRSIFNIRSKSDDNTDDQKSSLLVVFPLSIFSGQMDIIAIRRAIPHGVDNTEIHYTYFAPEGEDPELTMHRVRQGSTLFGPEGMISIEDACVFERIQRGAAAGGRHSALKGTPNTNSPYIFKYVDEANINYFYRGYRELMDVGGGEAGGYE